MVGMHITLESWRPHKYPEECKQELDVLDSDLSEDNLVGEAEEALVKITRVPIKGDATEKVNLRR